jgi:hypothetical protein
MNILEQSCFDIITKNMEYQGDVPIYLLYDRESPLAKMLSDAYIAVLNEQKQQYNNVQMREFMNPPQPLYRGGFINQENPHTSSQTRVITSHNITENIQVGFDHHKKFELQAEENIQVDPQIESIKNELISLPK